jgi:hypothetical protein
LGEISIFVFYDKRGGDINSLLVPCLGNLVDVHKSYHLMLPQITFVTETLIFAPLMKFTSLLTLLFVALITFGCKSEFETVRTSGDAALWLKTANDYYDAEEYTRAQTLYELSIAPYRGKAEAEQIAYRYAYTYYYTRQYVLASYYFKNFATTYGGSSLTEEAD